MKRTRKLLIGVLATLTLSVGFTACGGTASGQSEVQNSSAKESISVEASNSKEENASEDVSSEEVSSAEENGSSEEHVHSYTSAVTKQPDCENKGEMTYTCVCEDSYTEEISALGHTGGSDTCTVGAICTRCEEEYGTKLGHDYTEGACTRCGEEDPNYVKELEYELNSDGKSYSVVGMGTYTDTDLVIPSTYNNLPVTSIGNDAFQRCSSLTSVKIGDSVTSIGAAAFQYCHSLTSVKIPDSVTSIGNHAFSGTGYYDDKSNWENGVLYIGKYLIKAKEEISGSYVIKEGTLCIADGAFVGCDSLTSVEIGDSVTIIGNYAFRECSSLTSVKIGDSVTIIGDIAFYECSSLTSVEIGDNVTSIGGSAFFGCYNLKSVVIPNSVTSIASNAFSGCRSLTRVVIPNSVTSIGDWAFEECSSLTSIEIGGSVTSIGCGAFWKCSSLTIYCEAASQPSGWNSQWNNSNCPVVWGYTK